MPSNYPYPTITFRVEIFYANTLESVPNPDNTTNLVYQLNNAIVQVPGVDGWLKHGDTFTLHGERALQVKSAYTTGNNPILSIISNPTSPTADFTADITSGFAPLTVQFTDLSTGNPNEWYWDFDTNATIESNIKNPIYIFQNPGTYNVNLTVSNDSGISTINKSGFITVTAAPTQAPQISFIASDTNTTVGTAITFTYTGDGSPTLIEWDWTNDDTFDATGDVATFTYSTAGTYSVTCRATNNIGTTVLTETNLITITDVSNTTLVVSDASVSTSGNTLTVNFSENMTGSNGFTLSATNGPVTLTYIPNDFTNKIIYSLSRIISQTETVTLSYTPGDIADMSSNLMDAFTNMPVTNNSTV